VPARIIARETCQWASSVKADEEEARQKQKSGVSDAGASGVPGTVLSNKDIGKIFPNLDGRIIIIDDRLDVWSDRSSSHLLRIMPYLYFLRDVGRVHICSEKYLFSNLDHVCLTKM
jgi:hypothetical protein